MTILDRLPQLWGETIDFRENRSPLVELGDRVAALESIDFAGTKGAKVKQKKNCVKGNSCGFTCIRQGAVCRSEMKGKEKEFAGYLKKATDAKPKAEPKPKKDKNDIPDVKKEPIAAKADKKNPGFGMKQPKMLDIESIGKTSEKFSEDGVKQILADRNQAIIPVVRQMGLESYSVVAGGQSIADYREAVKRDPSLKDRMDVHIVQTKAEADSANKEFSIDSKYSKTKPWKKLGLLDIESISTGDVGKFNQKDIEFLSSSIQKNGGTFLLPVVRQTGINQFVADSKSEIAVHALRAAIKANPDLTPRMAVVFSGQTKGVGLYDK